MNGSQVSNFTYAGIGAAIIAFISLVFCSLLSLGICFSFASCRSAASIILLSPRSHCRLKIQFVAVCSLVMTSSVTFVLYFRMLVIVSLLTPIILASSCCVNTPWLRLSSSNAAAKMLFLVLFSTSFFLLITKFYVLKNTKNRNKSEHFQIILTIFAAPE